MFKNIIGLVNPSRASLISRTGGSFCNLKNFHTSSFLRQETSLIKENLSNLKLSNELYAVFKVHNRPYLVTKGDIVTLPYKVKAAEVGDTLVLNDVTTIGSRNYKLIDYPIDPSLYTLRATIVEKTKRAFQVREITKQRQRRVRHAKSKGDLTVIRISELKMN
ncbi:hypothetical protein Kpol_463p9 [Vanderwaltozyma polyspora DSM 70294]|uniref:Large ribosomal subunit protein bL21m n=1 Tax=Vanderwaltozyma polyspora (strain ATCC 22028 / DSM 70294 / BCRC 21397 / CBS 2163 / NBRC 10782 / NRRL Y-8283 / UCD 57-17) TaxID=436907 RepID=A7TQJ6_VANPO|nr:uncharacterized protein Kpol_463p9 [Vanderwaltozyma polyspora DSM 70294]EDO15460.1 hypothetical protein Kpol_463p9 [Vanderwaltozyma polyspora DSM 70294]